jgi:hypothetical protein
MRAPGILLAKQMRNPRRALVIVKVQLPLTGSGPALVYEGAKRQNARHIATLPERVRQLMGDDLKAYFRARPVEDGWNFLVRVSEQPW